MTSQKTFKFRILHHHVYVGNRGSGLLGDGLREYHKYGGGGGGGGGEGGYHEYTLGLYNEYIVGLTRICTAHQGFHTNSVVYQRPSHITYSIPQCTYDSLHCIHVSP